MNDTFPKYRKYVNGSSFFKIISAEAFDEVKLIGNKCVLFEYQAKIYPDRVLIQDMLNLKNSSWEEISEEEYINALQKI